MRTLVWILLLFSIAQAIPPTTSITPYTKKNHISVQDQNNCMTCQWVVQAVEGWMSSNYTKNEIRVALQELCALVPTMQSMVNTFCSSRDHFQVRLTLRGSGASCYLLGSKQRDTNRNLYAIGLLHPETSAIPKNDKYPDQTVHEGVLHV